MLSVWNATTTCEQMAECRKHTHTQTPHTRRCKERQNKWKKNGLFLFGAACLLSSLHFVLSKITTASVSRNFTNTNNAKNTQTKLYQTSVYFSTYWYFFTHISFELKVVVYSVSKVRWFENTYTQIQFQKKKLHTAAVFLWAVCC